MIQRVNANLVKEIEKFGKGTWNECFHCGNCTATCPLTEQGSLFPRKPYRAMQMGLKTTLAQSTEPWLCYYCGDCSQSCPRDANPGETMMILRRYLTTVYDWTGISKIIYKSKSMELIAIFIIAIITAVLYLHYTIAPSNATGSLIGSDGGVLINSMANSEIIHIGDWIMAGILAFLLITNVFNMWYKIILSDKSVKVPFGQYFLQVFSVVTNFLTQKRFNKCDGPKSYWFIHLFLMLSYVMLFTMIVFFLAWFQTDTVYDWWHPQRLLGYIATIGLFVGVIYFINNRLKKMKENSKYSHYTDWTFLVLLLLTTATGILMHFFRIYGMVAATYFTYLIHLMVLVPMLVIEVPFSKWSHLAYRPVAVYFAKVKNAATKKYNV
jgi:quinone-modifying oxidoreductase, subunit QmoC